MENIKDFGSFRNMKNGSSLVTEHAFSKADAWEVISPIELPKSIVKAYIKKVKDESGQNIAELLGEANLAEMIVSYVLNTFMKIENLPSSIALGDMSGTPAQPVQPVAQVQPVPPVQEVPPAQDAQDAQAQETAQVVPAQETKPAQVAQVQTQTQQI